jgi:hypothetical protein
MPATPKTQTGRSHVFQFDYDNASTSLMSIYTTAGSGATPNVTRLKVRSKMSSKVWKTPVTRSFFRPLSALI